MIVARIIDTHTLLQLLWSAAAASLTVCICFALALRAASHASDARRAGRRGAALRHSLLAAVPGTVCAGAIVGAIIVLASG